MVSGCRDCHNYINIKFIGWISNSLNLCIWQKSIQSLSIMCLSIFREVTVMNSIQGVSQISAGETDRQTERKRGRREERVSLITFLSTNNDGGTDTSVSLTEWRDWYFWLPKTQETNCNSEICFCRSFSPSRIKWQPFDSLENITNINLTFQAQIWINKWINSN